MAGIQQLGDVRSGKLAGNITAFGRALRRAGVRTDAAASRWPPRPPRWWAWKTSSTWARRWKP